MDLSLHPVFDLMSARTSVDKFDPAFELDDAVLQTLVFHATEAPSAYNLQNWRFIAVKSPERKQVLAQAAYGQRKVAEAAATFIVCGRMDAHLELGLTLLPFHEEGHLSEEELVAWVGDAQTAFHDDPEKQRDEAIRSASMAAMNLMLAAQAMGLVTAPVGGFDSDALRQDFALRASDLPVMLIAVGKPAAGNWPRKRRRPVADVLQVL